MAKESLSEQAYRLIRGMIVRLELTPGAVVREDELQEQLEIGRTPIREALQRLARDQFLVVIPRRGMIVSTIEIAELSTLSRTVRCTLGMRARHCRSLEANAQSFG